MKSCLLILGLVALLSNPASAQQKIAATGEYFHDFGALRSAIEGIRWVEEVCAEAVPQTKPANQQAYSSWLGENLAVVDEAGAQFGVIERYWAALPPGLSKGASIDKFKAMFLQAEQQYKSGFRALDAARQDSICRAYPASVIAPARDFEKKNMALLASVRKGPALPTSSATVAGVVPPPAAPVAIAAIDAGCAKPQFPRESLLKEEHGTVRLIFLIDTDGKVLKSRVTKSSGFPRLDEAAVEGIAKCIFKPARTNNVPEKAWVALSYVWTLE